MTNKRITELTALDGDDVADNDVLAIVDVSDTTMAASGTTKKITVAELITDSAINNRFVQSSVLTTNDDILTRAAGVPARITRANLAADTAFTNAFVPKAGDDLWITPEAMRSAAGSPTQTLQATYWPAFLLDQSSPEGIAATTIVPSFWSTAHVDLWWTNAGAGSGDVRWYGEAVQKEDGDALAASAVVFNSGINITAPSQNVLKVSRLTATALTVNAGEAIGVYVSRVANDVGDTLANDAAIIGLRLVRAS
jgi:hypothetical protein